MLTLLLLACGIGSQEAVPLGASDFAHLCEPYDVAIDGEFLAVFEGPPPTLAVNVVLNGELVVDGEESEMAELQERLEEKAELARELAARTGNPEFAFQGELLLQIATDRPAAQITEVLANAQAAGFHRIQFVGRSEKVYPEPTYLDPDFGAQLEATESIPPETRQRAYAELTEGVAEACGGLEPELVKVRNSPRDQKCSALVAAFEAARPSCSDAEFRRAATVFQHAPWQGKQIATTATRALDPGAPVFEVKRVQTWASIVPKLLESEDAIHWVMVEP